jgi:hypothetical protein
MLSKPGAISFKPSHNSIGAPDEQRDRACIIMSCTWVEDGSQAPAPVGRVALAFDGVMKAMSSVQQPQPEWTISNTPCVNEMTRIELIGNRRRRLAVEK